MNIPTVIKDPDIPLHSITRAFVSIVFSFAIACFAGDSFADDFTDAVRSFKNQQYRQALSLFEEGASKQDPRSEYALGLLYQTVSSSKKTPDMDSNLSQKRQIMVSPGLKIIWEFFILKEMVSNRTRKPLLNGTVRRLYRTFLMPNTIWA